MPKKGFKVGRYSQLRPHSVWERTGYKNIKLLINNFLLLDIVFAYSIRLQYSLTCISSIFIFWDSLLSAVDFIEGVEYLYFCQTLNNLFNHSIINSIIQSILYYRWHSLKALWIAITSTIRYNTIRCNTIRYNTLQKAVYFIYLWDNVYSFCIIRDILQCIVHHWFYHSFKNTIMLSII